MYDGHYYTGKTEDADAEIRKYATRLAKQVREMASKLGVAVPPLEPTTTEEAAPDGGGAFPLAGAGGGGDLGAVRRSLAAAVMHRLDLSRPLLRSPAVLELQTDLNSRGAGLSEDGELGPLTLRAWLADAGGA
jgi:hypothetical protein